MLVARAAAVLLSIGLLVSIWQLDAVLKGMHQPAATSYGMADLADVLGVPPDSGRPETVVQTWKDFDRFATATDVTHSTTIVHLYLVLDFAFIALYAGLFWALIGVLRARLTAAAERLGELEPAATEKSREQVLLELIARTRGPTWSLIALVGFDVAENVLQWIVVSEPSAAWFWPVFAATVGKWLSLAALLLYVAVAAVNVARDARAQSEGAAPGRTPRLGYLCRRAQGRPPPKLRARSASSEELGDRGLAGPLGRFEHGR